MYVHGPPYLPKPDLQPLARLSTLPFLKPDLQPLARSFRTQTVVQRQGHRHRRRLGEAQAHGRRGAAVQAGADNLR